MNKFESTEAAFASQNFDPAKVKIEGVPERHVEALKRAAELFILHDAVNPEFQPDYDNYNQDKFENVYAPGSPSGGGFRFHGVVSWRTRSLVGSRLVSESREAAEHVNELGHEAYKGLMVYQRPIKK